MDIYHFWMTFLILSLALNNWTLHIRLNKLEPWSVYGKEEFRKQADALEKQAEALESKCAGLKAVS